MKSPNIIYSPIIPILFTAILLVVGLLYKDDIFQRPLNTNIAQERVIQKCPDDYADDDAGSAEYIASTNKWTNDFFDAHPGATLSDWSAARYQFWVDNNCVAALERYRVAKEGNADPAATEMIRAVVQEAADNPTQ